MRRAQFLLISGLCLGLLGDALFHGGPEPGLNVPIWMTALTLVGWWLYRTGDEPDARLPWLFGLALFFAWCVAWRASPFLRLWDMFAVLAAGVVTVVVRRERLLAAQPLNYVRSALLLAGRLAAGAAPAFASIDSPERRDPAQAARTRASVVGMALAVPVVLVFGSLLFSADPVLESSARALFAWDLPNLLSHAALIVILGWIAVGALRVVTADAGSPGEPVEPAHRWGQAEIGIPLGTLALLLAIFIGVQARYLFGAEAVLRSAGFTYAEFARRGFFQLVFVAMLVLPLLYGAQWMLDRDQANASQSFRALVIVLAALVALVIVSAVARMRLYVGAYGLTEDRFYATVLMLWIAIVLAWFVFTEFSGRPVRFTTGAVLAGFATLALLNVVNPEAMIARTNVGRLEAGLSFDAKYAGRLSADAVPALVGAWPSLSQDARCTLRKGVLARTRSYAADWRQWTWGGSRGIRAMQALPATDDCGTS